MMRGPVFLDEEGGMVAVGMGFGVGICGLWVLLVWRLGLGGEGGREGGLWWVVVV